MVLRFGLLGIKLIKAIVRERNSYLRWDFDAQLFIAAFPEPIQQEAQCTLFNERQNSAVVVAIPRGCHLEA